MGIKGRKSWVGSKCHVVETANKGEINFITNMVYQRANEDDSKIHSRIIEGNTKRGLKPNKVYADANYIAGAHIKEYRQRGQELMGYIQNNSKKDEDFRPEKFDIDIERRVAICPAGKKSMSSGIMKNGDIFIYFSRDTCSGCTHFHKCVGDTNKAKKRVLSIKPHYAYIRERRLAQKTESFQKEMSVRAQVEGTISEATRFHGLRYSRYRGEEGHQSQFYLTGAAINVKRLIKAITIRTKELQKAKA